LLALIVHNIEAYQAYVFYIMQYILANLNAFLIIIGIGFSLYLYHTNISENNNLSEKNNSPIQLISQLKGYFSINPILALCLIITMFSFIGLPPLVGFFGKQMVLISALDNNNTVLVIVAILTSVIGAVYYLGIIKQVFFNEPEYKFKIFYTEYILGKDLYNLSIIKDNDIFRLSSYLTFTISILTLIIILFMLMPQE
jgi:NADH-ubiquinone oxidoreductase chain 2